MYKLERLIDGSTDSSPSPPPPVPPPNEPIEFSSPSFEYGSPPAVDCTYPSAPVSVHDEYAPIIVGSQDPGDKYAVSEPPDACENACNAVPEQNDFDDCCVATEAPLAPAESCPATPPPAPAPPIISLIDTLLEDGDIRLQTTDGVIVGAHSLILQAASPHFRGPLAWHKVRESPIVLDHDSFALRTLLMLLYPTDEKPSIPSVSQLVSVLETARTLHLTSFIVRETLNAYIQADPHPLRAWTLATAFGYPDAQKSAIERYFESDSSFLDNIPEEMRLVDAYQILQLNAAKERALKSARLALSQVEMACANCEEAILRSPGSHGGCPMHSGVAPRCPIHGSYPKPLSCSHCRKNQSCTCSFAILFKVPVKVPTPEPSPTATGSAINQAWHHEFVARTANLNPFSTGATSDMIFEMCYLLHPARCGHATATFSSENAQKARVALRKSLRDIVSHEVDLLKIVGIS